MRILVPIKRVVDPYARVRPLPDGSGIDTAGVKFDINPFDEIAVEEAVRQKEANPEIEIVAATIGSADAEEQLRKALAMGADRAILIETADAYDPRSVAAELAELVREVQTDLVLMGKQATDDDCNQVGQMLAARLDWPQATFASKLVLGGGSAQVTRETDTGEETLSMPCPCVVTTDLRLNEPRYIALPGIIKARSKPLERRAPKLAAHSAIRTLRYEAPPGRGACQIVASVDELVAALRDRGAPIP